MTLSDECLESKPTLREEGRPVESRTAATHDSHNVGPAISELVDSVVQFPYLI